MPLLWVSFAFDFRNWHTKQTKFFYENLQKTELSLQETIFRYIIT